MSLHWSFPRTLRSMREDKEREEAEKKEQDDIEVSGCDESDNMSEMEKRSSDEH